ncbi:hypothetical protein OE766_03735 [Pararhizobium sp. YC-54]|uniref:hypothetical protein n=1 Tax=Pararhizobium sp. YC-54 TaxID=2986920 RepID=UPI0021F7869D|nr:hypothetical protein [Pararhizobium sp. YC-54]MCV9997349.1 hypothetical protein [Pararhizobium sp. YC-54]
MTQFIDIKPGQLVLAFDQPYFYPGSDLAEWLEGFTTWGGGWDGHRFGEIFVVHRPTKIMPKTYLAKSWRRGAAETDLCRYPRENVVQAFDTEAQAIELRDKFHAIGVRATKDIEQEAARLIKTYANKREAQALKEIHAALPHVFAAPTRGKTP